ncbi:hypothetical protein OF83DRAFT_1060425 [Amylostereum chailletii]|nr:hypothetical protein OF83DRAFT_1060425 [Amylostereum chailletii]
MFTTQPETPGSLTRNANTPTYLHAYDAEHAQEIHMRPMAPEPFTPPGRSLTSTSSGGPRTPADSESLDDVWGHVRRKKEMEMAATPSKVKSLETWSAAGPSAQHVPDLSPDNSGATPSPPQAVPPRLRKRKSMCVSRSSHNTADSYLASRVTATFNLPGVQKEDMHVSYQVDRLIVTWQTVKLTERVEANRVYRDREEKTFSRTIPLPEKTKFGEVQATMHHRQLVLTYPKMRAIRARPRHSTG